jgi:glutamate-1-semialdehyde aminotransferase
MLDVVPDMITISKALGNGWPVAALLGKRDVLESAAGMHLSATFHGDVAAMAAALKTIELVEQEGAAAYAHGMGVRLLSGLESIAKEHGVPIAAYPEPIMAMPFMRLSFANPDLTQRATAIFYTEVLERGVLLHPRHLWFPSLAHSDVDLERTLEAANAAMRAVARFAG